ncbi:MAG TPA: hypothetical protein VFW25_16055 [Silvibacterium sp.]|nr:hypothetical protein [Silvibacterium sp.]
MKLFSQSTFAALLLAVASFAWFPSNAQQTADSHDNGLQHLPANSMNAADQAALERDHKELMEAAEIYGYNLAAGNWTYRQTLCAAMPDTVLLHFWRQFPDGSESLFTALMPRDTGRVRIVPVLYRNTTPFVPAPRNPRNYALFNALVSTSVTNRGAVSNKEWIELSACYAEMTGATIDLPLQSRKEIGIAGAPSPTIHANEQDKAARVTLATREGESSYRVWSVSFDRNARVTAVVTEDRTVQAEANPTIQPVSPAGVSPPSPKPSRETASPRRTTENAAASEPQPSPSAPAVPYAATTRGREPSTLQASDEPGWKLVLHPTNPPAKIEPTAPPPPEKFIPSPPDSTDQTVAPQR